MRKNLALCPAVLLVSLISVAFTIAAPEKVYGSAITEEPAAFIYTVQIHEEMSKFIAQLDMWPKAASSANLREYDASITVMYEDGTLIQYIADLEIRYRADSRWVQIDPANPANFHFADYNQDGFLDMAVRHAPGGSMINDPHYFWLWDAESEQFRRNYELETLSDGSSVSLAYDGNVRSFLRLTLGHYVQETYKYLDGILTPYITRERKPFLSGGVSTYKTIITDHINETKSIMLEPF